MEIIKINPKGQIVIPQRMRKELDITEESILAIDSTDHGIVIKKVDTELVNKIKRSLEDIKNARIKEWKG